MNCIICDGTMRYYFSKTYQEALYQPMMAEIGTVRYERCPHCGFVASATHRELDSAAWEKLNHQFHQLNETDARNINQPPYIEQALMIRLLIDNGIIDPARMLDYAAGAGTLSQLMQKYFAVSLPVYDRYVPGEGERYITQPEQRHYSAVFNSAMFEHVLEREDLDAVNRLVSDDGVLLVHTVVGEQVPQDPQWFYLRPPVHTAFHTNKSMNVLMEQWGYRSSIYSPKSKTWLLQKAPYSEISGVVEAINRELQCEWLYARSGFCDYWK